MMLIKFISFTPVKNGSKITAIKALRTINKMGLKEAKETVEALMVGTEEFSFNVDNSDPYVLDALDTFAESGGYTVTDNALVTEIRICLDIALNTNELAIAEVLITTLKNMAPAAGVYLLPNTKGFDLDEHVSNAVNIALNMQLGAIAQALFEIRKMLVATR